MEARKITQPENRKVPAKKVDSFTRERKREDRIRKTWTSQAIQSFIGHKKNKDLGN